jgi:hypothetical protein
MIGAPAGAARPQRKERAMAIIVMNFEIDDYDAWKSMFDKDPVGRSQSGMTNHKISRGVENPNEVFIRTEFPSVDEAKAFRQRILDSGVLERAGARMKSGPTVAEVVESVDY